MVNDATTDAPSAKNQVFEAEKILDHKKMRSGKYKYLVKWVGHGDSTWEPQDNLRLINKNKRSTLETEYWK
jgi:outer membrane protein OmpA-like peptidoglycan-associated protein